MAGTNSDQVSGVRLEASEERGVLCSADRRSVDLAPGQGGVLDIVTCDRLWLQRTPTHPNTGLPRLRDHYRSWAHHLWCVGGTKKTTSQPTSYLVFESVHSPMKTFTVNRKGYAHLWDLLTGCNLTWLCLEGDGKGIKRLFIGLRGQRGSIGGVRLQAR